MNSWLYFFLYLIKVKLLAYYVMGVYGERKLILDRKKIEWSCKQHLSWCNFGLNSRFVERMQTDDCEIIDTIDVSTI